MTAGVMVTGAAGSVGLALVEALLSRGDAVTAVDVAPLPATAGSAFARLPGALTPVVADVRDAPAMAGAMAGCDRLVIAAAITPVGPQEMVEPERIVAVNVGAVATAVRLAAAAGVCRVVHLSSVAVYGAGPDTPGPLREGDALRPAAIYGVTKAAGEAVALRLAALSGLDLVAARLGGCFGPWEHATGARDALSPQWQVLQAALAGEVAVLDADAARDWLYVRDGVAGLLALLDTPGLPRPVYNVGTGAAWPMSAFADALAPHCPGFSCRVGRPAGITTYGHRPSAAIDPLLADTGYRPRFGPAEAAADWLRFACGQ